MKHVDEQKLEQGSQARYEFLAEFIGFDPDDVRLIQAAAPHIGPKIADLVDRTYEKLLAFDATARHFLLPQSGLGEHGATNLADLSADDPHIRFRKDHLNRYFMALIGRSYDAAMVRYLDMVGKMHTAKAGSSEITVPLVQMNALMGLISDLLTETLIDSALDDRTTQATVRSFQKLLWIQNDLISRHYADGEQE